MEGRKVRDRRERERGRDRSASLFRTCIAALPYLPIIPASSVILGGRERERERERKEESPPSATLQERRLHFAIISSLSRSDKGSDKMKGGEGRGD